MQNRPWVWTLVLAALVMATLGVRTLSDRREVR